MRHWVGEREGTGLRLSLAEAAWCVAGGRLDIGAPDGHVMSLADILAVGAGTGRRELTGSERKFLGRAADRFPLLA